MTYPIPKVIAAARTPQSVCLNPPKHELVGVLLASTNPTTNIATMDRPRVAASFTLRQVARRGKKRVSTGLPHGRIHGINGTKPPDANATKEMPAASDALPPRSSSAKRKGKERKRQQCVGVSCCSLLLGNGEGKASKGGGGGSAEILPYRRCPSGTLRAC